jgi:hypothetical protein
MNDLFALAHVEAAEPDLPMTLLPPIELICSVCGSADVFRVQPGQLSSAQTYWYDRPLHSAPGPMSLPGQEIPSLMWCLSCDPVFAGRSARLPDGEAEYRSWELVA